MGTFATAHAFADVMAAIPRKSFAHSTRIALKCLQIKVGRSRGKPSPSENLRVSNFTSLTRVLKQNERIRGTDDLQVQALLIPVRRILRDDVVVEAVGGEVGQLCLF